jgi:hypothetical protein
VLNIGLYLEAELTLYAVEINVVREYRLCRAQVEKRGKGEDIVVKVEGEDDREKTSG